MTACTFTRLLVNPAQTYDLAFGVLAAGLWIDAGGLAGNGTSQVGVITMPPGNKQLDLMLLTGRLEGDTVHPDSAYLNGLVLDMTNAFDGTFDVNNDPARVRGIIGTITSVSNGSVRGIHLTIIGQGAAAISGTLMQLQPAATSFVARGFLVESLGAPGVTECLYLFSGSGSDAKFGLAAYDCSFTDAAIVLKSGTTNGRIRWTEGGANTYITSAASGIIIQAGTWRKLNNESISWRNAAGAADLAALKVNGNDQLVLGEGTVDIMWGKPTVALGGGGGATLGTVGGTGPAGTAQTHWLRLVDSTGVARFLPLFT